MKTNWTVASSTEDACVEFVDLYNPFTPKFKKYYEKPSSPYCVMKYFW